MTGTLRCPRACSKLSVFLPHKVEHEQGKARFDMATKMLHVTLRIIREDPF